MIGKYLFSLCLFKFGTTNNTDTSVFSFEFEYLGVFQYSPLRTFFPGDLKQVAELECDMNVIWCAQSLGAMQ